MPKVRKDTSILEKYREKYEAGEITQVEILKETGIGKTTFRRYIFQNNWNIELAKRNQSNLLYEKIAKYKDDYEQGKITIGEILKKLKIGNATVINVIKKECWNGTVNQQKSINNLKPIFWKNKVWEKGFDARKKRLERLRKLKMLTLTKNIKEGEPVFYNGKYYTFIGMVNNKPLLKGYGGMGYCNSKRAIIEYERASTGENLGK